MNQYAQKLAIATLLTTISSAPAQDLTPYVIGGSNVKASEWIGQRTVALMKSGEPTCTATLLSDKVALTAAHCISGSSKNYYLMFQMDVNSLYEDVYREISKIVVHSKFDSKFKARHSSDLAIVVFTGGLPPGYTTMPLASEKQVPKRNSSVTIAGYGTNKRNGSSGYGVLRKTTLKVNKASTSESEIELNQKGSSAACWGDSGGPAFVSASGGGYVQLGVTSRGEVRREKNVKVCGNTVIYTRIGWHLKWIKEQMAKVN